MQEPFSARDPLRQRSTAFAKATKNEPTTGILHGVNARNEKRSLLEHVAQGQLWRQWGIRPYTRSCYTYSARTPARTNARTFARSLAQSRTRHMAITRSDLLAIIYTRYMQEKISLFFQNYRSFDRFRNNFFWTYNFGAMKNNVILAKRTANVREKNQFKIKF